MNINNPKKKIKKNKKCHHFNSFSNIIFACIFNNVKRNSTLLQYKEYKINLKKGKRKLKKIRNDKRNIGIKKRR